MILAQKQDIPQLIKILLYPFQYNLSVNRCIKQDKKKLARISNQIRYVAKISIKNNWAFMNNDKTTAVLCVPSDGKQATVVEDFFFIRKVSGLKLGFKLMKRERLIAKYHPSTPFCHLWYIGVDITLQRKGEGSKMMRFIQGKCREENLPIYLETSNEDNIRFYQKNGFEMYDSVQLPGDDFTLYFFKWLPEN